MKESEAIFLTRFAACTLVTRLLHGCEVPRLPPGTACGVRLGSLSRRLSFDACPRLLVQPGGANDVDGLIFKLRSSRELGSTTNSSI